ncbi:MAG: hypothetical protein ACXWA9_16535 [Acidimicrobiia bacterium]
MTLRTLTSRQKNALAFLFLGLLFLLPLRGLLRAQGPPMEEGFMLVFPERVLAGDVPNLDFLHLYGPGSLWVLAGVYKVFGTQLVVERLFALLQQIGVVLGMYGLARYWGRTVALFCAVIALVIIVPPIGLTALAWDGGVALGLLGLLATLQGRRRFPADASTGLRWALVGGIVSGFALLYRLDLVIAVGLGLLAAWWGTDRRFKLRLAGGFAIGVAGYLVHLVMAGPGNVVKGMVLQPVFDLRAGRRLPVPPPWSHFDGFLQKSGAIMPGHWPLPALRVPAQLTVWFFALLASVIFLIAVAIWDVRRDRTRFQARVLLAVALFGAGMVPQAMQRVDSAHFAWVSCVPFAFVPIAVLELLRVYAKGWSFRRRAVLSGAGVLLLMVLTIPQFTAWAYTDYVAQTFGRHRLVFKIEHGGRVFYYGRQEVAQAANELLAEVPKWAKPGDRLFVGTTDLRKTPLSEAYLYYMLPDYPPATRYIEMDPGVANAQGSGMASDLRSANLAILSGAWNDWSEPNDSRKVGSDASNQVLVRDFCLVASYGVYRTGDPLYELFVRRPKGRPCPAGTTTPKHPGPISGQPL